MSCCKECIYFKICAKTDIHDCSDFEARASYLKCPCEVGQKVWFIRNDKITETYVEKIIIKSAGIYLKLACNALYETSCRSIGKTVFFSQKAAEAVLN